LAASGVFDQRAEDGVVVLLDSAPPVASRSAVRDAVTLCPVAAIRIEQE
jgi:ferredoxin